MHSNAHTMVNRRAGWNRPKFMALQLPVADLRPLLAKSTTRLARPAWADAGCRPRTRVLDLGSHSVQVRQQHGVRPLQRAHDVSWTCWRDGGDCGIGYQVAGMQSLLTAVRHTGATNPVLLGGLAYANDLSQWLSYRPSDPAGKTIASWHAYNFNSCNTQSCWDSQIAPVAATVPLVTGELGENDCAHGYLDGLMTWLDNHNAGYLGWGWNTFDCSNFPALISNYDGTPTSFGIGLRDHLAALAASTTPTPTSSPTPPKSRRPSRPRRRRQSSAVRAAPRPPPPRCRPRPRPRPRRAPPSQRPSHSDADGPRVVRRTVIVGPGHPAEAWVCRRAWTPRTRPTTERRTSTCPPPRRSPSSPPRSPSPAPLASPTPASTPRVPTGR